MMNNTMGTSDMIMDTLVSTGKIVEIELCEGQIDEFYMTLDQSVTDSTEQPTERTIKDLVDLKFDNGLEDYVPDSLFKIDKIVISRKVVKEDEDTKWEDIAIFNYNSTYNLYQYIDRFIENSLDYVYGVTPILTNGKRGQMLISQSVGVDLDCIYITDKTRNFRMIYDITIGEQSINTDVSFTDTLGGVFPIATVGSSRYKSGSLSLLPLSHSTIEAYGQYIDKKAELENRHEWIDFLNNGNPKVIRFDDGDSILALTYGAKITPRQGNLSGLADISFDYTEIGELTFENMEKYGLLNNISTKNIVVEE